MEGKKKKERKAISFAVISHNLLIQIMKQMPLRFSGHEDGARLAAWFPLSSPTPTPPLRWWSNPPHLNQMVQAIGAAVKPFQRWGQPERARQWLV